MSDDSLSPQSSSSTTTPTTIHKMLVELSGLYGRETVMELIDIYIRSSEDLLTKIDSSRAAGDLSSLSAHAHSLKSASANLGAMFLSDICKNLEKSKSFDSDCSNLLKQLSEEWPKVLSSLQEWKTAEK